MSDEEKIEKIVLCLQNADLRDDKVTADEIYHAMKNATLSEIAQQFLEFFNLIYNIRAIVATDCKICKENTDDND